jgi:uncharacterized protein (TIGR02145 family)
MITSLSTKHLSIMNRGTVFLMWLLLISGMSVGQSPTKFSYQAIIRAVGGQALTNQPIGMRLSILQGSDNGNAVYVETHTGTTNAQGLVTVQVGGGTVQSGSIGEIDWANGPYFVKTETDPEGGSIYTITGTSPLLSVPYSLFSANGMQKGTNYGDMLFWDGSNWVKVPIGQENQVLTVRGGKPSWTNNYGGSYGEVTDIDGNTYKTVKIGNQTWMADDLKVTRMQNGDLINSNFNNQEPALIVNLTYSTYYNGWTLTDPRNVCPIGWRVPSASDYDSLISYLGTYAGVKLKTEGFTDWIGENQGNGLIGGNGTNESGFSAKGLGWYLQTSNVTSRGNYGFWGSNTAGTQLPNSIKGLFLGDTSFGASVSDFPKTTGVKIRCIKQ